MLFTRTLSRSTSVSSACCIWLGTPWMLVCRPQGYVELWREADDGLAHRFGLELSEVVHLVPLPPQLPGFLAVDRDRVTLVFLLPGESQQSSPSVLERGSIDLAPETAQQAAKRRIGGAICSRCIYLHDVPCTEFLDLSQHGDERFDAARAVEPAKVAAVAAAGALEEQAAADTAAAFLAEAEEVIAAAAAPAAEEAAAEDEAGRPSLRSHPLTDISSDSGSDEDAGHDPPDASTTDAGEAAAAAAAAAAGTQAAAPEAAATAAAAEDSVPKVARYVTAMSLQQGYIHFVEVFAALNSLDTAALAVHGMPIPPLPDSHLAGSDGRHDEVVSLELLPRKQKGSRMVVDLVLLCSAAGSMLRERRPQRYLRLARMRFDSLTPSAGPVINWIAEAPFYNRRVEPTAALLHIADNSLLTLSQRQVLIHTKGLMGELACDLPGLPVAAVEMVHQLHVIGDASGYLHLLDMRGSQPSWQCRPIKCASQLSVATSLCFMPCLNRIDSDLAGWLFVGSHTGDSQLLAIPLQLTRDACGDSPISDAALHWQALAPHTIDNLAPIQDQLTFEHPAGSGEQRLAMCCGADPTGTLRVAGIGVGLAAWAQVQLNVQGRPLLWAIKRAPEQGRAPPFLVLSSEVDGATSILEIRGNEVQLTKPISALRLDVASLLVANLPDLIMVQVTAQAVRTMPAPRIAGGIEEWEPPPGSGAITVAACASRSVVVACGATIYHLEVLPPAPSRNPRGKIRHVSCGDAGNQVASLALFEAGHGEGSGGSAKWWHRDGAYPGSCLSPVTAGRRISTFYAAAPALWDASLPAGTFLAAVHRFGDGGTPFLFVGTSSGEVIFCLIHSDERTISLGAGRIVQAGLIDVLLARTPVGVLVISDQALLLRRGMHYDPSDATAEAVDAQRVHGSDAITATAPRGSAAVPNGLVWLTGNGELSLGALDPQVRLRWSTARLGDTPLHVGLLPASGTLLAATRSSPNGTDWLRLMHCTSLQQLVEVQLRRGQQHTALHAGRVPLVAAAPASAGQKRKHADTHEAAGGAAAVMPSPAVCPVAHPLDVAIVAHHGPPSLREQAAAAGGGQAAQLLSAQLSLFTVLHRPSEDAAEDEYQVQLLGSHPLPSVGHAVTLLHPAGAGDACQLVVACHSGVQVYGLRAHASGTSNAGSPSISLQHLHQMGGADCAALLRPIGGGELAVGPLLGSLLVCGPDVGGHPTTAAATAAVAHDIGNGAQAAVDGSAAPDALGAQQRLRVRSADAGILYALDFLPLPGDRFLVATHPGGVLELLRFRDLEAEAEAAAAAHVQHTAEAGRQPDAAEMDDAAPDAQHQVVPLGMAAACRMQHSIVGLLPGRLGVPHSPLPASCLPQQLSDADVHVASSDSVESTSGHLADSAGSRTSAVFVSRDGGVGIIQMVSRGELELLQEAQDVARSLRFSRHDCTGGRTHEVSRTLESYAEDADGEPLIPTPMNTADGDLIASMLDADPKALQPHMRSDFPASATGVRAARLVQELSLGVCDTLWR